MKILFICVANSARSQMAEGLARHLYGHHAIIVSAGSEPFKVNPFAVQAMKNIGIDISSQYSKAIDAVLAADIDLLVTLCADEICPLVPSGTRKEHWPFKDPGVVNGSYDDVLASFESIRNEISAKLLEFGKKSNLLLKVT